jgi:hypothetical protein
MQTWRHHLRFLVVAAGLATLFFTVAVYYAVVPPSKGIGIARLFALTYLTLGVLTVGKIAAVLLKRNPPS